jgi:hypothetical protein
MKILGTAGISDLSAVTDKTQILQLERAKH